jgi:hypothetical protein
MSIARVDIAVVTGLTQYRITRPGMYEGHGVPGVTRVSARQGYYVWANSPEEAVRKISQQFRNEISGFDIQLWNGSEDHGRLIGRLFDLSVSKPR